MRIFKTLIEARARDEKASMSRWPQMGVLCRPFDLFADGASLQRPVRSLAERTGLQLPVVVVVVGGQERSRSRELTISRSSTSTSPASIAAPKEGFLNVETAGVLAPHVSALHVGADPCAAPATERSSASLPWTCTVYKLAHSYCASTLLA